MEGGRKEGEGGGGGRVAAGSKGTSNTSHYFLCLCLTEIFEFF